MDGPSSFSEELREIAGWLRQDAHSHVHVNRAATRIDHLGRQLHGIGYVRHREIAGCLTAAIGELSAWHTLPEEKRAEAVQRAIGQVEAALAEAEEGVEP
jgi:hypothetical protein